MHRSAFNKMKQAIETYAPLFEKPKILDFGSRMVNKQTLSHRLILEDIECDYLGIDVAAGPNVDVVMPAPYTIPLEDNSVDIVITGQVIEHVPYFWASFMELARVLKKGGYILCTAPSRGHIHSPPYDCWRYYPDGYKAIASFTGLYLVESSTHWPKARKGMHHFDYASIPDSEYWGDSLGVFQKPESYDRKKFEAAAKAIQDLANATGDLNAIQADLKKSAKTEQPIKKATKHIKHSSLGVLFPYYPNIVTDKVKNGIEAGWYEAKEAKAAKKYMKGKNHDKVLELGGGLGFMSSFVKNNTNVSNYILVEADPSLIPYIQESHELNKVSDVLVLNGAATSDPGQLAQGYIELSLGENFWSSSVKLDKPNMRKIKIPTISLPNLMSTYQPNVLLIDIEGAEADLFDGLKMPSVNKIVIEMHPHILGKAGVEKIVKQIEAAGLSQVEKDEKGAMMVFSRGK